MQNENKNVETPTTNKEDEINLPVYKSTAEWLKSGLLGILIGLAIIIPGISGSTISIIFKLYDRIINAISNIIKKFKVSFLFLLPLALGMGVGFLVGFFTIQKLLDVAILELVFLFAGLMIGSCPTFFDEVKDQAFKKRYIFFIIIGLLVPVALSSISIFLQLDSSSLFVGEAKFPYWMFLVMIPVGLYLGMSQTVPGISATAFLMCIGMFAPIMNTVHLSYWKENPIIFAIYLILVVCFLLGAFGSSKAISYLLKKSRTATFYTLIGFSIGSIICMFYNPEIYTSYKLIAAGKFPDFTLHISLAVALLLIGTIGSYCLVIYQRKKNIK